MSTTPTNTQLKRWIWLLAALPLASGAALVIHILAHISLGVMLLGMGVIVAVIAVIVWRRLDTSARAIVARRVRAGILAGIVGVLAYDGLRWFVTTVFHMTFAPFDSFPAFGRAILSSSMPETLTAVVGTLYHFTNGLMFAIAYMLLFGGRRWWIGIFWALGLEALMLALYPGWLHPKALEEFMAVSMLGHVAYGTALGGVGQYLFRKQRNR